MKVCFVDDDYRRYEVFKAIINNLQEPGISVEDGFNGKQLYQLTATQLEDGIKERCLFLVDLSMPLIDEATGNRKLKNLCRKLPQVTDEFRKQCSTSLGSDFELAYKVLSLCHKYQTPTILISANTAANLVGQIARPFKFEWHIQEFPDISKKETWGELSQMILKHVDIIEPILQAIENSTREWFKDGSIQLEHPFVYKERLKDHSEEIRKAFRWMPYSWWENWKSAKVLHEILKTFCGSGANWMSDTADPKPFSIGAAYLLFLHALHCKFGYITDACLIPNFANCQIEAITTAFLGQQRQDVSKKTLKALFNLFRQICYNDKTDGDNYAIRKINMFVPGNCFQVILTWKDKDNKFFDDIIGSINNKGPVRSGTTVEALDTFARLSQARFNGFGAPGHFYLHSDKLVIEAK